MLVTLVGNPNTGKSTIFNSLCRANQQIGNFPGTTIEKKLGTCKLSDTCTIQILDLPGIYSLNARGLDEKISYETIIGKNNEKSQLILFILDGTNLRRNLFLYSQLTELGIPILVVVSMIDLIKKNGIKLNLTRLEEILSTKVIAVNGHEQKDLENLKEKLNNYINNIDFKNQKKYNTDNLIQKVYKTDNLIQKIYNTDNLIQKIYKTDNIIQKIYNTDNLKEQILFEKAKKVFKNADIKISLFELRNILQNPDLNELNQKVLSNTNIDFIIEIPELNNLAKNKTNKNLYKSFSNIYNEYNKLLKLQPALDSINRYKWIEKIVRKVEGKINSNSISNSNNWDNILTHPIFGFLIFASIMYFIFTSIYAWAKPFMNAIEGGMNYLNEYLTPLLINHPIISSLLTDGIISGVGSVLTFLPQIIILFFFISILEDSGYLVRAAYMMDKLLSWTGLNGRAFIPLLSSFACAIPGIMATRVMTESRARLSTILIAPLMSCSARLPIYLLFIGALIEPFYGASVATFCLFFMHILGLLIAIPLLRYFNKESLKKKVPDLFIMEFPPIRRPLSYNVYRRVYSASVRFLKSAGTIIFAFSIIIWALAYFPLGNINNKQEIQKITKIKEDIKNPDSFQSEIVAFDPKAFEEKKLVYKSHLEESYLGMIGKTIAPIFKPLGFDWKITIAILSAFPAREVLITSLGIIYNIEDSNTENINLRNRIINEKYPNGKAVYTPIVALSLMIFFALCSQCMGTLSVIKKELGSWKWPIFVFIYMTGLAYFFALITYQIGSLF